MGCLFWGIRKDFLLDARFSRDRRGTQEANKSILLPFRPKDETFASSHQLLPGSDPVSFESASCLAAFYEGSPIHGTGSISQQLRDFPEQ